MENNHLVVGAVYEYQNRLNMVEPFKWTYHDDDEYTYETVTFPYQETYVFLNIVSTNLPGILSVKVLSSAGTVGRLYINPDDWKRLDQ